MTHLWTIGFQVVNFLLLLFLLHRYLWKPVRATIDARKKMIDDASAGVKARADAAEKTLLAQESIAVAADHERADLLAATAIALAKDRDRVLADARAVSVAELQMTREKLAEEQSKAAVELTDTTLDLAITVAKKLLGEVRGAAVASGFLDRVCEHLEGLPASEIASLRAEIESSRLIHVATAPALDDAAKALLVARVGPIFGAGVKLDFVVDDALIAGAELRFPHARLGHSFSQSLAAARKELTARVPKSAELTPHEEIVDK